MVELFNGCDPSVFICPEVVCTTGLLRQDGAKSTLGVKRRKGDLLSLGCKKLRVKLVISPLFNLWEKVFISSN